VRAQGSDRVRQARLCVLVAWILGALGLIGSLLHTLRGSLIVALAFSLAGALILSAPLILRASGSLAFAGNLIALAWFSGSSAAALARGGLGGPTALSSMVTPLLATLLVGSRAGILWGAGCAVWIAMLFVARMSGIDMGDQVPVADRSLVHGIMGTLFMAVTLAIGLAYEHLKNAAMHELRERADEIRRAEEQRLRAETDAKVMFADRMASIGRLAAGTAHEINNPLSYVMGNLDVLREELARPHPVIDEDLRAAIDEARDGAIRIRSIVRDLKTFSRAEEEGLISIDVHHTLDAALRMVNNEIRHRARLVKTFGEIPPVMGNDSRLAQVFVNVLLNAAQAIPVGRAQEDTIEVRTSLRDGRVAVEIADTGIGIPEELLERVMDPFFTTKPLGVGTGLGLSVSRNIIERMGGRIDLKSTLGKGTTVTIELQASNTPAKTISSELPNPVAATRVLVIDDEPPVARTLARLLRPSEVRIALGGKEALEVLEKERDFDVIFCDLMMPDLTGIQVFRELERSAPELLSRIVFTTGGSFGAAAKEFLESANPPVLENPFDEKQVRAILGERLNAKR
jgi:signal transduction histidine kinase/CheY-like chemotaxis protein